MRTFPNADLQVGSITYTVVDGPTVELDASATATEADETDGTLDMTLTRNFANLSGEPAIVTYTIGGDATRGANADYMLTVGGAAPATCNASGVGCTYRFPGSAPATEQTAPVVVMPRDDSESEDDEMVTITITALSFPDVAQANQPDSESISIPDSASEVTITDNDADAVLERFSPADLSIFEENDPATFHVVLSSAPSPAEETTITLALGGIAKVAISGDGTSGDPYVPDDADYTIELADGTTNVDIAVASDAATVTVATGAFSDGGVDVEFTINAVDNPTPGDADETIIVRLMEVTDQSPSTDYDISPPAARTITIEDDDVAPANFCADTTRTGGVRSVIVAEANKVSGETRSCDTEEGPPTVAELRMITELDLEDAPVTELMADDLMNLDNVETLMLPLNAANQPSITSIAFGALDAVLPSLTDLQNFPPVLKNRVSVAPAPDSGDNIQQGDAVEFLVNRTNPFADANITFTLTATGGAEEGNFTVTSRPVPGGTQASAASQSTLGTLAIAPNQTNEDDGMLAFGAREGARIVTISATSNTMAGGSARFEITGAVISLAKSAVSGEIIERTAGALIRTLRVTPPAVVPTLSPSSQSISEKSGGTAVITLDLNIPADATGYGTTAVTFEVDGFGEGEGIPSLATSGDGTEADPYMPDTPTPGATGDANVADYTLSVEHSGSTPVSTPVPLSSTNLATLADGDPFTFVIPATGRMATFTFTAINDERREDSETVNLTITAVNFDSGTTMGSLISDPLTAPAPASVTITEISSDAVMRETEAISNVVGKEQVAMVTRMIRQRVSGMTSGAPQFNAQLNAQDDTGMQLTLAENPQTIQDFFSQMALESSSDMDDGGNYSVWARGQYISISGSPALAGGDSFSYDGTISGFGSGIERRYKNSLVGLSLGYSTSDVDLESGIRGKSTHKETLTVIAPYAAWQPNNGSITLWGTAGAGFGTATINSVSHSGGSPSVQVFFAQGGADHAVSFAENSSMVFGASALTISKTIDSFNLDIGPVPEIKTDIFQAQVDATLFMPVAFGESVIRPYVGLASVHDIGDVLGDDRHAMEGKVGVSWLKAPWTVDVEGFTQFLREDEKAWGVFGEVSWVGTSDFDGLFMGMTGGHGTSASMSDAAASTDSVSEIDTTLSAADSEVAEWSFGTNTEYGFAAPLLDTNGRATPFFRTTHSADARVFESGMRLDVTNNVGLTMDTKRHMPADDAPYSEHAVGLEARWEF